MSTRFPQFQRVFTVLAVLFALATAHTANAAEDRSFSSNSFFLILDGVQCGVVKSLDGGSIGANVINEQMGSQFYTKKHIGTPVYEPITAQIGFSMAGTIYQWIQNSWITPDSRHGGAVVTLDNRLQPKSEIQFLNALITETVIPACETAGRDTGFITIKFAPELTRSAAPESIENVDSIARNTQLWQSGNFKLTIDGLDCSKVSKIDSFTIKQKMVNDQTGDSRGNQIQNGRVEFPDLRITFSEISAQSWIDWHKDFVVNGNNGEAKEKNGTLVFLGPNLRDELARITFYNLGIFNLSHDKVQARNDQVSRLSADLYCERMEFKVGGDTKPIKARPR